MSTSMLNEILASAFELISFPMHVAITVLLLFAAAGALVRGVVPSLLVALGFCAIELLLAGGFASNYFDHHGLLDYPFDFFFVQPGPLCAGFLAASALSSWIPREEAPLSDGGLAPSGRECTPRDGRDADRASIESVYQVRVRKSVQLSRD